MLTGWCCVMQEGLTPAGICCTDPSVGTNNKAAILTALGAAHAVPKVVCPYQKRRSDYLWRAANSEPDGDTICSPVGPSFFSAALSANSYTLL